MRWMNANPQRWKMFLLESEYPKYPNYGEIVTGGCLGFGMLARSGGRRHIS